MPPGATARGIGRATSLRNVGSVTAGTVAGAPAENPAGLRVRPPAPGRPAGPVALHRHPQRRCAAPADPYPRLGAWGPPLDRHAPAHAAGGGNQHLATSAQLPGEGP